MTNKIYISIPKPCGENWDIMTTTEKGKFCASCKKNVIDFTTFSDREIIKEFDINSELCGRFSIHQINRNLILPKEKSSVWLILAASVIAFLGLGNQTVKAQEPVKTEQTNTKIKETKTCNESDNEEIEINGKIIIELENQTFEDIDILVNGKDKIFHPYFDGKFCVNVKKSDSLLFSKSGFINYYTTVRELPKFSYIELIPDTCQMSFVGRAIAVKKRSFLSRLIHKNKYKRKKPSHF